MFGCQSGQSFLNSCFGFPTLLAANHVHNNRKNNKQDRGHSWCSASCFFVHCGDRLISESTHVRLSKTGFQDVHSELLYEGRSHRHSVDHAQYGRTGTIETKDRTGQVTGGKRLFYKRYIPVFIRLQIMSSGRDSEDGENSLRSTRTNNTNNEMHKIVVNQLPRQDKTEAQ